jgi:BirA family biotin operon repressor/biotin-[acetyl-CoA-carboxylase] ligase
LTGRLFDLDECLDEALQRIAVRYEQIQQQTAILHDDYIRRLYRCNEWKSYHANNEIFEGRIIGVNPVGMLEILTRDGIIRTFGFKEVEFQ